MYIGVMPIIYKVGPEGIQLRQELRIPISIDEI